MTRILKTAARVRVFMACGGTLLPWVAAILTYGRILLPQVGGNLTSVAALLTQVGAIPPWVAAAPTYGGIIPTWVGEILTQVGEIPPWVGNVRITRGFGSLCIATETYRATVLQGVWGAAAQQACIDPLIVQVTPQDESKTPEGLAVLPGTPPAPGISATVWRR